MEREQDSVVKPGVRRLVLEGTFSMEEMEMADRPRRRKAEAGPARKKVASKKAAKKKVARKKVAKKKVAAKKVTSKKATNRKLAKKAVAQTKVSAPAPATVELEPRQTIKNIDGLVSRLEAAAGGGAPELEIDLSGVESVDTAVLQLLVGFANDMSRKSVTIDWKSPSAEFIELAKLADLCPRGAALEDTPANGDTAAEDGLLPVF